MDMHVSDNDDQQARAHQDLHCGDRHHLLKATTIICLNNYRAVLVLADHKQGLHMARDSAEILSCILYLDIDRKLAAITTLGGIFVREAACKMIPQAKPKKNPCSLCEREERQPGRDRKGYGIFTKASRRYRK